MDENNEKLNEESPGENASPLPSPQAEVEESPGENVEEGDCHVANAPRGDNKEPSPQGKGDRLSAVDEAQSDTAEATETAAETGAPLISQPTVDSFPPRGSQEQGEDSSATPRGDNKEPSPQGKGDRLSAVDEAQSETAEATETAAETGAPLISQPTVDSFPPRGSQEQGEDSSATPRNDNKEPSPQGKGDRLSAVDEAQSDTAEAVKMTLGKKAANIIVNVVITVLLIFVVFVTVSIILSAGNGYTSFFGYTFLGVETDSMDGDNEDSFAVGDLVTIKILDEDEKMNLQVGEIVTFYDTSSGTQIINSHRIISIESRMDGIQYYRTQGDNVNEPDNFVLASSMVIGKVTGHTGGWGYVFTWVSSQTGFFVCVVLPSFALVVYCIVNLIMTIRARDKAALAEAEAAKAAAEAENAKSEAEKEAEIRKKILAEMGLNEDGTKKE